MMIYTSCGDKSSSSKGVVLLVSCVSDRKDSWKARGSLTLVFKIAFDTFLIDLIGFHLFKSTVTYILERRFVWKPKESSRVVWITSWLPSRGERWPDQMAVLREYLFLEEEKRREDPGWFRALCSSLYEQFFFLLCLHHRLLSSQLPYIKRQSTWMEGSFKLHLVSIDRKTNSPVVFIWKRLESSGWRTTQQTTWDPIRQAPLLQTIHQTDLILLCLVVSRE